MKHPVKYNNLGFRIVGSLAAAQFIVMYGEKRTFFELLHNRMYYLALIVSFVIAFSVTCLVHIITKRLDRKYSWSDNPTERSVFQFVYGFLPSALAAAILAWVYFTAMGVDIVKVGYFRLDYPAVILLLLLLNMYYPLHYFVVTGRKRQELTGMAVGTNDYQPSVRETIDPDDEGFMEDDGEQNNPETGEKLQVYRGNHTLQLDVNAEACFLYRSENANWIQTFSNNRYGVNLSLTALINEYCGDRFFQINRQMIIHKGVVRGYMPGQSAGSLQLELKPGYGTNLPEDTSLLVSQDRVARFRKWMEG